jgi:elongation factor P
MVIASELKGGTVIRIDHRIYRVLEVESKAGTAKLSGVVKAKLSDVRNGRMWEQHFRPQERLEELELEKRSMEFLFSAGDACTFMNPNTFEQVEIPRGIIGPAAQFLQPGMEVPMEFFAEEPISVVFPAVAEARVERTAPTAHSQQDSAQPWKQATLENGLSIQVPLFIAPGEMVRVEVKTGRYLERAHNERRRSA